MISDLIKIVENEAEAAFRENEVPVAALIFDQSGQIIAKAHNQVEKKQDVTHHAEMLVLKLAQEKTGSKFLNNYSILVNLEPCLMCATALSYARIKALYFCLQEQKYGAVINGVRVFENSKVLHKPDIYPDLGSLKTEQLLKKFFQTKR